MQFTQTRSHPKLYSTENIYPTIIFHSINTSLDKSHHNLHIQVKSVLSLVIIWNDRPHFPTSWHRDNNEYLLCDQNLHERDHTKM